MTRKTASSRSWTQPSETPLAVIREVSDRDVPRLLALYAGLEAKQTVAIDFASWPGVPGSPAIDASVGQPDRQEWLKSLLRRGFNFVAEEAGRLVAHLVLIRVGDAAQMAVFVHPDYRRRGIGTALLRVALDQARDMDLRHVWVAINPTDSVLQDNLAQFGFIISRQSENSTEMALAL